MTMLTRRTFLGLGAAATAALALDPLDALARTLPPLPASALRLTLVHTNDVHSHLDPYPRGRHAGLGGAAQRASLVKRLRREHPNVLLLDAGDIFQGTPYYNLFGGEAELRTMSASGYLAATIGNHEFDNGIEELARVVREHAKFPMLNANYDFRNTPMEGLTRESMVHEIDGLRIGLLGLGIKLDGLVSAGAYGDTQYRNPVPDARRVARQLRHDEGCDFVIALSHININGPSARNPDREPGDRDVIREVPEIDVVIGGHNHNLLRAPELTTRADGSTGVVNQAGWAGTHLGFMQFDIYGRGKAEIAAATPIGVEPERA